MQSLSITQKILLDDEHNSRPKWNKKSPSTHQRLRLHSLSWEIQLQINCIIQYTVIYVSNVQRIDHIGCRLHEQQISINSTPSKRWNRDSTPAFPAFHGFFRCSSWLRVKLEVEKSGNTPFVSPTTIVNLLSVLRHFFLQPSAQKL